MLGDKRGGKIALVAHCVLNQNSRVLGLAEEPAAMVDVVNFLMRNGIGIIQMPCPELIHAGVLREAKTRDEYDNATFRSYCREIASGIIGQIKEYSKGGVETKIVIGVDGSPSCGVTELGIFMDELRSALMKAGVEVPFYGVHHKRLRKDLTALRKLIG